MSVAEGDLKLNRVTFPLNDVSGEGRHEALRQTLALQSAIFNSANFSSVATDAHCVIQIFNVGAERMLGYAAADVLNRITPADISDPAEVVARAVALSIELGTAITPGFEALVFKASRGIEDIYELTYIRKDGSRFPAVVSVTALRDRHEQIIGYLLISTDNTARRQADDALREHDALLRTIHLHSIVSVADQAGLIVDVNEGFCINLPGINGIQALKILAALPETSAIPVIALSANAMPRDIEKGMEAGFFRYLTKPIKVVEFMESRDNALKLATADSTAIHAGAAP
jgi:CheY-like chemotaxis protein